MVKVFTITLLLAYLQINAQYNSHMIGIKTYELTNHLGNVLEVTIDRKIQQNTAAEIVAFNDYYPYGMLMEGRQRQKKTSNYRYAFQGQEKDDGIKGIGNSYNYTYRMHDSRLGRFFEVDPLSSKYPHYSSYQFSGNRLLDAIELEGLEEYLFTQTYDENNEVVETSLVWDENATPLEGEKVYYKIKYQKGEFSVEAHGIKQASDISNSSFLVPTVAPQSIINTSEYYAFRDQDFKIRSKLMGLDVTSPDYYLDYGDVNIRRFKLAKEKLSPRGQEWLDRTLLHLQRDIEQRISNEPDLEFYNDKFNDFAFDSHVPAYEKSGLFSLPIKDLYVIGTTPKLSHLLSEESLRQVRYISHDYIENAQNRAVEESTEIVTNSISSYINESVRNAIRSIFILPKR